MTIINIYNKYRYKREKVREGEREQESITQCINNETTIENSFSLI